MDQTDKPLEEDFVIVVDDVDKTPDAVVWSDANTFTLQYAEATLGPSVIRVRYSKKNILFHSNVDEIVTPFDMLSEIP
jgi:hypothetical protein